METIKKHDVIRALLMISIIVILTACTSEAPTPNKTETSSETEKPAKMVHIRMANWSKPLVEQAPIYVAQEKGWFQEAGIDFEMIPGAGGGDAVKNIIAGNAEIAFANVEAVLLAAENGAKLKAVYNIYPVNVFNVISLKANGITKAEDLKGKKIGVYSLASGTLQNLEVLLHSVGLTKNDVEIIPTGVLNFAPLMEGQVDATAATDTGLWHAQQNGLGEVNILRVKDILNTPSDVFVVQEKYYEENQDSIRKFLEVYKRSMQFTIQNPEEAAKIAIKYAIDGTDEQRNLSIIQIRNQTSMNEDTDQYGLGWINTEVLQQAEEVYLKIGLLKQHVDVNKIFTNELVEKLGK
jgi:NitT/TauT family transport system substrate-binding protein